jgi:hypothetical protein
MDLVKEANQPILIGSDDKPLIISKTELKEDTYTFGTTKKCIYTQLKKVVEKTMPNNMTAKCNVILYFYITREGEIKMQAYSKIVQIKDSQGTVAYTDGGFRWGGSRDSVWPLSQR